MMLCIFNGLNVISVIAYSGITPPPHGPHSVLTLEIERPFVA